MLDQAGKRAEQRRLWAESGWSDVAAYLGPNAECFHDVWSRHREATAAGRTTLAWSWNWPAFLFGPSWFAYRQAWAPAALMLIVPAALAYFSLFSVGGYAGFAVVIALNRKAFVLQDAVSRIDRIRRDGGDTIVIAVAGRASMISAIVVGAILPVCAVPSLATR